LAELLLEQVSKVYDKSIYAVNNVSFSVRDREFVVLLGPSGCGKTTILRLIAGLEDITAGKIMIDHACVNDVPPSKRDIAMVFQNYALYPHMTVEDNISFGLRMRKYPAAEVSKRVSEAVEILELRDFLKRKPRQLSGGQRQRVALGRAMVRQPKLFLFDEPLSNLDAKLRVQMRAELARLHKRLKATIVYVTHDQVEAMTLGEKIVVMKNGEVQQISDPMTLYRHPRNKFVAGFIGTPPMNFIEGRIACDRGRPRFLDHDRTLELNDRFAKYDNREVVFGLRPADFAARSGLEFSLSVEVIEPVGNEIYVYGRWGDTALQARVPEDVVPEIGQPLILKVDFAKVYLFDAETENALE
jgi:multiple sugar transport system ATP-binding protein